MRSGLRRSWCVVEGIGTQWRLDDEGVSRRPHNSENGFYPLDFSPDGVDFADDASSFDKAI
jgi:hypothetical protein